jgi:hypothetical protein
MAGLSGGGDESARAASAASTVEMPRSEETGRQGPQGPVKLRPALLTNLLAACFLAYIFCWNLTTVTSFELPERLEDTGDFFGLGQTWSMFAPEPSDEASWYVMPGILRGGHKVDLMGVTRDDFHMHPVSWDEPDYLAGIYETNHWRKYMSATNNLAYPEDVRIYFGDYVCDEWNARHKGPKKLKSLKSFSVEQQTPPPGVKQTGDPTKAYVWKYSCS